MIYGKNIFNEENKFEQVSYAKNSPGEVIEDLKRNVFVVYKDVVCYKEVLNPSPFSVNILFDEFERIVRPFDTYAMLIDVSNAKRPDAKLRIAIGARMSRLPQGIFHCAYVTGKKPIINTAIRFLMFRSPLKNFSISSTIEVAIKKIENARR